MAAIDNTATPLPANLVRASFKGIAIDVVNTSDQLQKAVAQHEYPFVDGADLQDMGEGALGSSWTVVFWGTNYKTFLNQFLQVCAERGAGDLIHPVFGLIRAQVMSYRIHHEAEQPDYCEVSVEFLQHSAGTSAFSQFQPAYHAETAKEEVQNALVGGRLPLEKQVNKVWSNKLRNSLLGQMVEAMEAAKRDLLKYTNIGFITSSIGYLTAPIGFAKDLQGLFKARVDALLQAVQNTRSAFSSIAGFSLYAPRGTGGTWRTMSDSLKTNLWISQSDVPLFLQAHVQQQRALALADAFSRQLALEADNPALAPQDIEAMVRDVREQLQSAVQLTQGAWPDLTERYAQIESLKAVAAQVQTLGLGVIRLRPPFIARPAPSDMNLHLLAHQWYNDYTRAAELQRLNPQISNPNFVMQGQMVYGYAE